MLDERDLRTSPLLPDGSTVADLVDLDRRDVSMRVLSDPGVYEAELEHLFSKAWILLGHESEIPEPGDYVMRRIAEDPVVVTRNDSGSVEVLLNVCTHRGMQVCRAEVGNATKFRCPYHGWVFGTDGRFLAAPFEKEMYGDALDKSQLGLQRARVETFGGLIFANWDEHAPPLDDFIGEYRWCLDTLFRRTTGGVEILGAPQRWVVHANWKCAGEQFAGDGYHAATLHRFMSDMGYVQDWNMVLYGIDVSTPQGHGLRCGDLRGVFAGMQGDGPELTPEQKLRMVPPAGMPPELLDDFLAKFDEQTIRIMSDTPPALGGMFPNVGILVFQFPAPDGEMGSVAQLRTFQPLGTDRFEMTNFIFVEKDASEAYKDRVRRMSVFANGVSGIFDQDDAEAWPAMQVSASGAMGRKHTIKYQALLGENRPDYWVDDGSYVYDGMTKDDNQWNWWKRYREYLSGGA